MKKGLIMFLLVVSVSVLLIGCDTDKEIDDSSIGDSFEKTQKVEVIPSDGSDVTTISDDNDIKEFVDALKIDQWDSEDVPSEATEAKIFKMYQKDTAKFGESENKNDDLNEVATMTTYKDVPNIKFNVEGFSFDFKIPKEVAEYLNLNQ
jgi:hypothetical protein